MKEEFIEICNKIKENYTNYDIRYNLVLDAIGIANKCNYKVGFRLDKDLPFLEQSEWIVVVIHTPEKQMSWHMPADKIPYDGH